MKKTNERQGEWNYEFTDISSDIILRVTSNSIPNGRVQESDGGYHIYKEEVLIGTLFKTKSGYNLVTNYPINQFKAVIGLSESKIKNYNNVKLMEDIKKDVNVKIFEQPEISRPDLDNEATPQSDKVPTQGVENIPPETNKIEPKEEKPLVDKDEEQKQNKEYFGSKGQDTHYYLVRVPGETAGIIDLQIVTADGQLKYSAKEQNIDLNDEKTFVVSAVKTLGSEIDLISMDLVTELDLLGLKEEEKVEKERLEKLGLGTEPVPPVEQPKV